MTSLALPFKLAAGEWRHHPARTLAALAAIAVGVAMGYAIHLVNRAALVEFTAAVRAVEGEADLEIRGPRSGFDESLYGIVAALPQVAVASPLVEVAAKVPGKGESLTLLGIDVFRAGQVQPRLVGRPEGADDRLALLRPDNVFLSPAALAWLDAHPGEALRVQVGLEAVSLRIAGTLPAAGAGQRLGVMDIAGAQWRLSRLGVLQRIALKLRPGSDPQSFAVALATRLPPGVIVARPADSERRASNLSRAYRVNLTVLAMVALVTGAFLVFSTQALAVIRRRAQLALLRALGLTRRGTAAQLMLEAGLIGLPGAALGVALGYAAAAFALQRFGGDLGAGYFPGLKPVATFEPLTGALFALLGLAAALAGSVLPAMEAARAAPAAALKAGDEEAALAAASPPWPGALLLGGGGVLALAPPVAGLPLAGYAAIACLLLGGIALMPAASRALLALPPAPRAAWLALALAQLRGAPGRASIGLGAMLASFSLMVAMAIMVASFRDSVDLWLGRVLPADLYLRGASGGDTVFFSAGDQARIAATPGVARAEFLRVDQLPLLPDRPPVALIARPVDAADPGRRLPLVGEALRLKSGDPPALWASEAARDLYGLSLGQRIELPMRGVKQVFIVAGIWRDYARQHGALAVNDADYRRLTGDFLANDAALWLTPGTRPAEVIQRLRAALPGGERIEFAEPGQIRALSLAIFDRSFAATYLLEGVAIVIGLTGLATGIGAQTLARAREFGMLRHLGLTRGQVAAMLAAEGALLAALGILAGLALGFAISLVLIEVVNPQSFHWTMDLHLPWRLLGGIAALLFAAATATALASGRYAMSAGPVRAVREDW